MAFRIKTQGEPRKNERRYFPDELRPTKKCDLPKYPDKSLILK